MQRGYTTLRTTITEAAWPGEALLPQLPHTTGLEIYDLRVVSSERLLSVSTLVGLVNRGALKIYGIENDDDEFWLQQLDPAVLCTWPEVEDDDVLDYLLDRYREQVAGLVIYDPNLLDTRNVASTLASLRAGLVVSPELADRLQEAPYHLPILADLRSHRWKSRVQAYAWAYKHLLTQCSPDLLAGLDPGICGRLRSFLVTQRVFTCWLNTRKVRPDLAAGGYSERSLFKRLLANFHAGALHLGWFINEPLSIRLTSRAAILTLASDHCTNLAIWSSLPAERAEETDLSAREASVTTSHKGESEDQASPSVVSQPEESGDEDLAAPGLPEAKPVKNEGEEPFDANAIYLSFTVSDGDNLQYCQHHLLHLWNDPARGSVPIGWTIAPALWQIMPRLAEFYCRTVTENDVLIAGPSGVAYMLPSHWPRQHRAAFLRMTAASLQAMDLTLLQVLDSRSWLSWFNMRFLNPGLQELFASHLATHGLQGIFSGAGNAFPSWRQRAGLTVYQNLGLALNPQLTRKLIQRAIARGKRFINVYIFAWNISPSDIQPIVQQLHGNIRVVTPMRLLELIRQAGRGE